MRMFVIKNLKTCTKYAVFAIVVLIGAIIAQVMLFSSNRFNKVEAPNKKTLLSPKDLATYNGIQREKLYLAVTGNVYDVTFGSKHYLRGSSYHYFIGKDGTRALVTGNFKDETNEKDHILDLPCNDLLTIMHWRQTFKQKYIFVGLLTGRYYDDSGVDTPYMTELKQKIKQCRTLKEEAKKQEQLYPPCNIAWSDEEGSKVWCTKSSGGVVRNWVGVPRQLYTPGDDKPQCVCVNDEINTKQIKEYTGCSSTSTECLIVES